MAETYLPSDEQREENNLAFARLEFVLAQFQVSKPGDRSDLDRYYAVTITDLEKVLAYFHYFVVEENYEVTVEAMDAVDETKD